MPPDGLPPLQAQERGLPSMPRRSRPYIPTPTAAVSQGTRSRLLSAHRSAVCDPRSLGFSLVAAPFRSTVANPTTRTMAVDRPTSRKPSDSGAADKASQDATVTSRPRNVLGTELECCCLSPRTGFFRDGYCQTGPQDVGRHTVCAIVTDEFLQFSASRGNNLMTPNQAYNFPGLKDGDKWCLCVLRWKEALEAGVAPKVVLKATHENSLQFVELDDLREYAVDR